MSESQELKQLVSLYTGQQNPDDANPQLNDQQLFVALVHELREIAQEDLKTNGQPVIIVRPPQYLPWILTALLAACVGFLIALVVMQRNQTSVPSNGIQPDLKIRVLDPERQRVEVLSGSVYSIEYQLLSALIEEHNVDPRELTYLFFAGEHITIRDEDLRRMPKLRVLAMHNCRVDLGAASLYLLEHFELKNCTGIQSLDLTSAKSLQHFYAVDCQNLLRIDGIGGQPDLVRIQISRCPRLQPISGWEGLRNLGFLELEDCGSQPVNGLTGLEQLEVLYFDGEAPVNLQPFAKMKSLKRLSFNGRKLLSLDGIQEMSQLTDVCIANPANIDWSPLNSLTCRVYLSEVKDHELRRPEIPDGRLLPGKAFWDQERTPWSDPK